MSVQIYPTITSSTIFEMTVWYRNLEPATNTAEDYREMIEQEGVMRDQCYEITIGHYPSLQKAQEALIEEFDYVYDSGRQRICFAIIREKAMYMQMEPGHYLNEWSFEQAHMVDQSLVRNYDLDNNRFYGRPADRIRHKIGDIVRCIGGDDVFWGIICALPPTVEYVSALNERTKASREARDIPWDSMLDYSDDQYVILTNDGDYMQSHTHILSHRVFKPDFAVPDEVRKILTKSLLQTELG